MDIKIKPSCPVSNGVPAGSNELMAMVLSDYYNGNIKDGDNDEKIEAYIKKCKDFLAERGHDDAFVERIKKEYPNELNKNVGGNTVNYTTEEEDEAILKELSEYKEHK